MQITDFNLSDLETEIFEGYDVSNIDTFIFYLELYKIYPRVSILDKLSDEFSVFNIDSINRAASFSEIEGKFNILIDIVSPHILNVICPIFQDKHNQTAINLALNQYDINFKYVTLVNFLELKGEDLKQFYKPEILFKRIVTEVLLLHATDVHFSVLHEDGTLKYPIQYRLGSKLHVLSLFELNGTLNESMIKYIISHKTDSLSLDLDSSAGVTTSISDLFTSRSVELRISANSVRGGYRCVIRMQEKTTTSLHIDELGFDSSITEGLYGLANKVNGITFITGAIRTGKNTTAFALANEMLKRPISIISYDSPIEVLMPFPQVDYKEDPDKLADCVRLAKKQDIDIAFLNELPSKKVAFAVSDLVNSSVGVITTIHLNRIWDLPLRLYEYYGDSYKDVILQINGVVNQKMFNLLCPNCRRLMKVSEIPDKVIRDYLSLNNVTEAYSADKCPNCFDWRTDDSGFIISKNQPFAEFIIFTPEFKQDLLQCNTTWEMSLLIKEFVTKNNNNLEYYMLDAIKKGVLHWSTLHTIL